MRINNLLTYDDIFWEVPLHENVLPVVERVLDKECLLSSFCSLVLGPGQEAQPIHEDTQLIPLPRPHIPITMNAIWALSDFRDDNGATRIVPGSHKYRFIAGIRQGIRRRHRDHAGRQRDAVRQRAMAWRRRQQQRCQALRVLLRLLLGLDAPAGKPAARHPPRDRAKISAALAGIVRLQRLQGTVRPHRQPRSDRAAGPRARKAHGVGGDRREEGADGEAAKHKDVIPGWSGSDQTRNLSEIPGSMLRIAPE